MNSDWALVSGFVTIGIVIVTVWVPRAMKARVRRAGAIVGTDEPQRPNVPEEVLPPPPRQAMQRKDLHDQYVGDATKLLNLARSRDGQSLDNLEAADVKLDEALILRPDSFEPTRLRADVAIFRAELVGPADRAEAYEVAADAFDASIDLRRGVPDLYLGLGWAWLGVMQHDESRQDAPINALAAFTAGHDTSRGNLWIIKGWGTTVDVMIRRHHPDGAAALGQYETLLATLRGPAALAGEWFTDLRAGTDIVWIPVPPLRDV